MSEGQIKYIPEKFQNAEQMWFWFMYSRSVRGDMTRQNNRGNSRRICELVDVETLVTKLYLCGKLNAEQLSIMKEYGDRRRAPHQYVWRENHAAAVWGAAMRVLQDAAHAKGWVE